MGMDQNDGSYDFFSLKFFGVFGPSNELNSCERYGASLINKKPEI